MLLGKAEFLFEGNYGAHFDVAPDGPRLLMVEVDHIPAQIRIHVVQNWTQELERVVPTQP